ncbi:MAG: nitrogen fixation protein NifS, partial [Muriicola sp.]
PTVSIIPLKKSVKVVYTSLLRHMLMLGMGDFYAVRPLKDMEIPRIPGVIRISFLHYTTKAEVDQLIEGLKESL